MCLSYQCPRPRAPPPRTTRRRPRPVSLVVISPLLAWKMQARRRRLGRALELHVDHHDGVPVELRTAQAWEAADLEDPHYVFSRLTDHRRTGTQHLIGGLRTAVGAMCCLALQVGRVCAGRRGLSLPPRSGFPGSLPCSPSRVPETGSGTGSSGITVRVVLPPSCGARAIFA